jgi:hypothetical protein
LKGKRVRKKQAFATTKTEQNEEFDRKSDIVSASNIWNCVVVSRKRRLDRIAATRL